MREYEYECARQLAAPPAARRKGWGWRLARPLDFSLRKKKNPPPPRPPKNFNKKLPGAARWEVGSRGEGHRWCVEVFEVSSWRGRFGDSGVSVSSSSIMARAAAARAGGGARSMTLSF